jgi:hypothetical protein
MQLYTVHFIWKLLYMFRGGTITHHQERKQLSTDAVDTVVCAPDDG